ncbi:hypothetical protein GCM10025858_01550 [Alicyclobacillus sacchari]|nr:hypothetical protein GCM10025858_01550 [Alicyclobacillus sacchari]
MNTETLRYDVVIVGGGSAVAAAVGAASLGAKTLLLEKNPYFGGAATHSSVLTICGFFAQQDPLLQVVGGVGQKFLDKLRELGQYDGPIRNPGSGNVIVPLDGETTKYAFDQLVLEAGVTPRLHTTVIGAEVDHQGCVRSITCFQHGGTFRIEAKAFVDASGEADLAAFCGNEVRFGDNEGHVQAGTLVMQFGGVSPDIALHRHQFTAAIWQAKRAGVEDLTKDRGMVVRLAGSHHVLALFADERVDGLDSASLTAAEMSARRQAWAYLDAFRKYVPGFKDAFLVQTPSHRCARNAAHSWRIPVGWRRSAGRRPLSRCRGTWRLARRDSRAW